jgi:hypothetical protein
MITWLYENCCTGAAWRWASTCAAGCGYSMMEIKRTIGNMSASSWTWHTQEGGLDIEGRLFGLHGRRIYNGFFPLRKYERAHLCSPSQGYRRFRGKTSPSYHNGPCDHVQACSRNCSASHGRLLEMMEVPSNTCWRGPQFDHLTACTIWRWRVFWTLDDARHTLHNIFDLPYNKELHCVCVCSM